MYQLPLVVATATVSYQVLLYTNITREYLLLYTRYLVSNSPSDDVQGIYLYVAHVTCRIQYDGMLLYCLLCFLHYNEVSLFVVF